MIRCYCKNLEKSKIFTGIIVQFLQTIDLEIFTGGNNMKATGIVRRIDDLGRVVVPKEIRKVLRIREGDPLEIYTGTAGEVILKKYSPIGELSTFAKEYAEVLSQTTGMVSCITDHDQVIAAAGQGSKEYVGKEISSELEEVIFAREMKLSGAQDRKKVAITTEQVKNSLAQIIQPIISSGDAIGSVILIGKNDRETIGNSEKLLVQTAAGFLGRQMEQ